MHRLILKSAAAVAFAALTVAAVPMSHDTQFVGNMITRFRSDIEFARKVGENAQMPALKTFATAMIKERQDQMEDLEDFRSRLGGGSPLAGTPYEQSPAALSRDANSDRVMIDQLILRHRYAVQAAADEAANGRDSELMAFARRLTYSERADMPELNAMRTTAAVASSSR
jgi:uncharacterized protein (DUF305 family)